MPERDEYGQVNDNTIQYYVVSWDSPEGPKESDRIEDSDDAYLLAEELLRKGVDGVTVWLRNEYVPPPWGSTTDDDPSHSQHSPTGADQ